VLTARLNLFLILFCAGCGGKAVMDDGSGGANSSSSSSTTGTTVSTSSSCLSCSEAIDGPIGSGNLCPSALQKLQALEECVCAQGNCEVECQATCSSGGDPSPPCFDCIINTCQQQFADCTND